MSKCIRRIGEILISGSPRREVCDCFIGPGYSVAGRDADIDRWLMETQEHTGVTQIGVFSFEGMTAVEIAQGVLLTVEKALEPLNRLLGLRTLTAPQVEDLIELTRSGENPYMALSDAQNPSYFFMQARIETNGGIALGGTFSSGDGYHLLLSTCGLTSAKVRSGTLFIHES